MTRVRLRRAAGSAHRIQSLAAAIVRLAPTVITCGVRPCESKSLHLFQQFPRFAQQIPYLLSLGDLIPREQAVLARVPVVSRCAGSRRTAVHAAALFAAHRG